MVVADFGAPASRETMRRYLYKKLREYLDLYVRPDDRIVQIVAEGTRDDLTFDKQLVLRPTEPKGCAEIAAFGADYVLLNGNIHYERDIQTFLEGLRETLAPTTRVIITFYSNLWKPLLRLATVLGLRSKTPEENWIAPEDLRNLLLLAGYELVREESKLLSPVYIPVLSYLANRFLAPLPGFRSFNLINIAMARPLGREKADASLSVSVIVSISHC